MRILKKLGKIILFFVLFIITFFVLTTLISNWRLKDYQKVSVTNETIPELFPVLVITQGPGADEYHAKTVFHKNLATYLAQNPSYTFLVPAGRDEQLNTELKQNSRASRKPLNFDWESPDPWWAYFKVTRISDDRQSLEVYHTWDDDRDNTSWYEATTKEIFPKYHQVYFGPGMIFAVMPISFLINCALWIIGLTAYKLLRRSRQKTVPGVS